MDADDWRDITAFQLASDEPVQDIPTGHFLVAVEAEVFHAAIVLQPGPLCNRRQKRNLRPDGVFDGEHDRSHHPERGLAE